MLFLSLLPANTVKTANACPNSDHFTIHFDWLLHNPYLKRSQPAVWLVHVAPRESLACETTAGEQLAVDGQSVATVTNKT